MRQDVDGAPARTGGRARRRPSRSATVLAVVVVSMFALLDCWLASGRHQFWATVAFYAVAILVAVRRIFDRRALVGDTAALAAVAGVSAALTASSPFANWAGFAPGEALVLLAVLLLTVRRLATRRAVAVGALTAAALVCLPLRERRYLSDSLDSVLAAMLVLTFLAVGVLVLGLYLRGLDRARTEAVAHTRASERTDMAAELHDFVAHHVTGILAEAQMGQMLLDSDPDRVRQVLQHIESAAADALSSMRQTVHLLRDTGRHRADVHSEHPAPRGTDDLSALTDLIAGWERPVHLTRSDAVTGTLPRPVQAAAFRIVREALTNTRKHAPDATTISVDLAVTAGFLVVEVRNDGVGVASRTGAHGLGLIGLRERVTALQGRLEHGPTPDHAWTVRATLPLDTRRRTGRAGPRPYG